MKLAWLAPDDLGGGVVSVAQACCRQASAAGHDATLLLALRPRGTHADEFGGFRLETLDSQQPHNDIPVRLVEWLTRNPQDVTILNSCEQADVAMPHVPATTRLVYAVHDTAERYFGPALAYEANVDAVLAVSETVAARFRKRMRDPSKLHVVLNGTVLPDDASPLAPAERGDDLVFLGGEKPIKGAFDCLALWPVLLENGFAGRLHWFGELGPDFAKRVERLPASERIVRYGRRPRREIFEVAAASKVVLMLSRVEPFGMATIECMGMGCLPLAWDIETGTKEIVLGPEGVFAPLGNFKALAAGVFDLLGRHAAQCGSTVDRVRREFSEAAMWSRYEAALTEMMKRPAVTRPLAGTAPDEYRPPLRLFQRLPPGMRTAVRNAAGRWPRLGYLLRDLRGR